MKTNTHSPTTHLSPFFERGNARLAASLLPLAALIFAPDTATSTDYTWTGAGDGYIWTTPANWSGGDAYPSKGDTAIFPATYNINKSLSLGVDFLEVGAIVYATPATFNLGPNWNPTFVCPSITLLDNAGTLNIQTPLRIDEPTTCTVGENTTLTFRVIKGTNDFIKNGPGELLLIGDNGERTAGATFINEGTFTFNGQGQLGKSLIVGDGVHDALVYGSHRHQWNVNYLTPSPGSLLIRNHGSLNLHTKSDTQYSTDFTLQELTLEVGGTLDIGSFQFRINTQTSTNLLSSSVLGAPNGVFDISSGFLRVPENAPARVDIETRLRAQQHWTGTTVFGRLLVEDIPTEPIDLWVKGALISCWDARDGYDKLGPGTLRLSSGTSNFGGRSSSMGCLRIFAGTLLCDNTEGNATGLATVFVYPSATLGGTGFICCPTTIPRYSGEPASLDSAYLVVQGSSDAPATLAPGSINETTGAPLFGTLTIGSPEHTSSVTLKPYSTLRFDTGLDTEHNALSVYGPLTFDAQNTTLEINISPLTLSGEYVLAQATDGISGTPTTLFVNGPGILHQTPDQLLLTIPPKETLIKFL